MRKKFECQECDAYGTISHELDSEFYSISVCPFCGAELDASEDDEDE